MENICILFWEFKQCFAVQRWDTAAEDTTGWGVKLHKPLRFGFSYILLQAERLSKRRSRRARWSSTPQTAGEIILCLQTGRVGKESSRSREKEDKTGEERTIEGDISLMSHNLDLRKTHKLIR